MSNFANVEYLQERLAAANEEIRRLREICERQAEMNRNVVRLTLALDAAEEKLRKLGVSNEG